VEKYRTAGQATNDNKANELCMLHTQSYINTNLSDKDVRKIEIDILYLVPF
jgi:hypothetical protein